MSERFLQYRNQHNAMAGIIIPADHYTQFQTCIIKKMKNRNVIFETTPNWELKCGEKKVADEYCWAMKQAVGRSGGIRSCSSVLGFGLQLDCLGCTCVGDNLCPELRLAQNSTVPQERNYYARRVVSLHRCLDGLGFDSHQGQGISILSSTSRQFWDKYGWPLTSVLCRN